MESGLKVLTVAMTVAWLGLSPVLAQAPACRLPWKDYYQRNRPRAMQRGWTGLVAEPVRQPTGDGHALVRLVLPDSPAAKAGIAPGDRILSVDGNSVQGGMAEYAGLWRKLKVGQRVEIKIEKGRQRTNVSLVTMPPKSEAAVQAYVLDLMLIECGPERQAAAMKEVQRENLKH